MMSTTMNPTSALEQITTKTVLKPMSEATKCLFEPIRIDRAEYLEVELDKQGKKFITQATRLTPYSFDEGGHYYTIQGEKHYKNGSISRTAAYGWQVRIPERRELGYGKWSFATTDFTVLTIHHIWPKEKLIFLSDDAKLMYQLLLTRFFSQARNAIMAANFKEHGEMPIMPDDFIDHPKLPLADYQKVALMSCLGQESFGLFMEQGTGKTPVVINRICLESIRKRKESGNLYRVLILCPNQVRLNWQNEFTRFSNCAGKTGVLRGDVVKRTRTLLDVVRDDNPKQNWAAAIISIDSVNNTWETLAVPEWDLIVIDESHYIKSVRTNRTKACLKFNHFKYRQRMVLTGTPIANSFCDLYPQLEFLGEGLSGFSSFNAFNGFHGVYNSDKKASDSGNPIERLVGIRGLPLLQERLARLTYITTKKDAGLKLPEKLYDISEVDMTNTQAQMYEKLRKELVVEIEQILNQATSMDKTVTANHILTRLLRLAQITSGHIKWDDGRVEQLPGSNPKVKELISIIKDHIRRDPLGKVIVWATFVEDLRIISQSLAHCDIPHSGYHNVIHPKYKYKDSFEAQKAFNCVEHIKVFVANPASAGEGLNIVGYDTLNEQASKTYTSLVVYFSSNWSMIQRSQSEDRAHRRGTRNNVRITDLVIPGTIDEEIRARVMEKRETANLIKDVRDILKSLKK